jgi:cysteine desulfurase
LNPKPKSETIYLDNNATTLLDARVAMEMAAVAASIPLNPSSVHSYGRASKELLQKARQQIAQALGVLEREVFFNSGATEGLNQLLRGIAKVDRKGAILSSPVEHAAVTQTLLDLEKQGTPVTYLPVGKWGSVTVETLQCALAEKPAAAICLMAVNNETGVKSDLKAIAALAESYRIPLIVDGVGLIGKELFEIPKGVSAICFSGHKFHGPHGTGFACVRPHLRWISALTGGGQERGKRAGTENLPGIVGLARATTLLQDELPAATERMSHLRDRFEKALIGKLPWITVNGEGPRIANVSNLCFHGVDGETLLLRLDLQGLCTSHGAACGSGGLEPSRVLLQMGYTLPQVRSSLRFSLSRNTTLEEIDRAVELIVSLIRETPGLPS